MIPDAPRELAAASLPDGRAFTVRTATADDVDALLALVHRAFGDRPVRGRPAEAMGDDRASVLGRLERGTGYVAESDGELAGVVMVAPDDDGHARLGRVCVSAAARGVGLASLLVDVVLEDLALSGTADVRLLARREYPQIGAWWARHGFRAVGEEGDCTVMERALPVIVPAPDAEATRSVGRRLAALLAPGDLLIATGELGAGKTTFTQGLGEGLGVEGPVISPTFVLSRVHPSTHGGPALVHVDAYRLGGFAELEDIDLEASLADSVTLVEWGAGVAEELSDDRLEVDIRRGLDPADDTRQIRVTPVGDRWVRSDIVSVLEEDA